MNTEELIPFLAVFAAVAMLAFAVWFFVAMLLGQRRQRLARGLAGGEDNGPPLLRPGVLGGPPAPGAGARLGQGFAQMIARTGLDLTAGAALAIIVLCGAAVAAGVYVRRFA